MTTKYHLGKNGPAPCNAQKRKCRYGDSLHGSESEVTKMWEQQQDEKIGFAPLSKKKSNPDKNIEQTKRSLSNRKKYNSTSVKYDETDKDIAMKIALSNMSSLSYTPIREEDEYFYADGFSTVRKFTLEDGRVGYFKSFQVNSKENEDVFECYGTNSLGATINEANSYRLAQAMGDNYKDLVPETVIREVDGKIGSFQEEAKESNEFWPQTRNNNPVVADDYRKAAIFDYVIGNLDRHNGNFLMTEDKRDKDQSRVTLIDNSFSFPSKNSSRHLNRSIFTGYAYALDEKRELTEKDKTALNNAKNALNEWKENGTINQEQSRRAIDRIDYLLKTNKIQDYEDIDEIYAKED